jgi:hypothetical protein
MKGQLLGPSTFLSKSWASVVLNGLILFNHKWGELTNYMKNNYPAVLKNDTQLAHIV